MRPRRSFDYEGVEYESIADLCRQKGIPSYLVYNRLRTGWLLKDIIPYLKTEARRYART